MLLIFLLIICICIAVISIFQIVHLKDKFWIDVVGEMLFAIGISVGAGSSMMYNIEENTYILLGYIFMATILVVSGVALRKYSIEMLKN